MTKRVLDVGNCPPDHAAIRRLVEHHFDAEVVQAHSAQDALAVLQSTPIDLVLVNRKLDLDYTDGLHVIRQIRASAALNQIPVMLITNYEEHQQRAMQCGAERGFGKLELDSETTRERLRKFLGEEPK
jgi:CheY-like chemotaxis protein